ncbi:MAG: helix-turn-helix transcriptional regulator [Xylophilus ampelinus]
MTQARDEALLAAFASVLKDIRRDCGFSQEQLALRAGVDRTFVGKLESGRNQPSLAVLFKLADASSVEPEEFVRLIRSRIETAKATK